MDQLDKSPPPEAWGPLVRFVTAVRRPLDRFLRIEAASGIVLLVATAIALLWANSAFGASYRELFHTPFGLRIGSIYVEKSLEWLINDGLMAIFFFVVAMEIRREIHHGELAELRRAALPLVAALGGMVVPALVYVLFAGGPETRSGWGVPMATDIAFAVGILALLGSRVPAALRVLLLALAVIDDLGAILVIAFFYSGSLDTTGFFLAGGGLIGLVAFQRLGIRAKTAYFIPGLIVWLGITMSGVHPTIAGVIVGLLTPVKAWLGPSGFLAGVKDELQRYPVSDPNSMSHHELIASLRQVDVLRREAMSPAESLIGSLHPWVAFGIMPIFALANAGVDLSGLSLEGNSWRVALGIGSGLLVGKTVGIVLASVVALRFGWASLPKGLSLRHLMLLGVVAGVGFTMALFIAQLAFDDAVLLGAAKLGVLAGSAVAAIVALAIGRCSLSSQLPSGTARTADEAESSTEM